MKKLYIYGTILLKILISTGPVEAQKNDISSQVTLANELYHEKNYQGAADILKNSSIRAQQMATFITI